MRRVLLVMLCMAVFCAGAIAQKLSVIGKVTDSSGASIPGASVKVRGSKTGVSADIAGEFKLSVDPGAKLVVSATGFLEQEVSASGNVMVKLLVDSKSLSEVVVTGAYGTKRSSRSTSYNAQVVTAEQLNTIRQTNLNNALAGKVSGLQVRSQSAGKLGSTGSIRLRGADGFDGGGDVIYVVDGTILPNPDAINMDDVEDVTVLQGPSASAQFGSQGQNGAIILTLKKGKRSTGLGIDVNVGAQFDNVYILPNYQNEYAGGGASELQKYTWGEGQPEEWKALDGKYYHDYTDDASWGPRMVGQEYIPWYAWYPNSPYSYKTASLTPQKNNAKDFYSTGVTLNNSVSFYKSTDHMNVRVSYGNIDIKGIIPTSSLKKNTFNASMSYDLNNHFTVSTNINYITSRVYGQVDDDAYSNQSSGSFNQWFHRDLDMGIMKELRGLRTPEGIYASWNHSNPTSYNPDNTRNFYAGNYWYNFYTWFDLVEQTTAYDRLYGDAALTYKINSDIKIKATYRKQQNSGWSEQEYSSELNNSGLQTTGNTPEAKGYYGTFSGYDNRQNFEVSASYIKKIGDFQINANLGTDIYKYVGKINGANTNNGLSVPDLFTVANSKDQPTVFNFRTEEKYRAIYGIGGVGWRNMLFADLTLRKDWYSTLPPDANSVFSKSFGGSFVFSDLIKIPFVSFGKLRGSWGEIPTALGTTSTTFGAYRYPGSQYSLNTFQWNGNILMNRNDQLVDPNIHGAVKKQFELGLEMKFLKNRLGFAFTYWDGSVSDLATAVTVNGASGSTSLLTNSGKITKKGIDLQLNARPLVMKNFSWELNATWGYLLENKVVSIADGVDRTAVVNGVWGGSNALPGLVHEAGKEWGQIFGNGIKRINGQPVVNDNGTYANDPSVHFGSVLPRYTGGIQNSFQIFNDFLINVNIDYQSGGKFVSLSNMWGSYSGLTARTATVNEKGNPIRDAVADGGGVHIVGVDADGKPKDVWMEAQDYFHGLYNTKAFDSYVYDLTFVKLREISVGYNIPVKKIGISKYVNKMVFSVVARNPVLIYATTPDFDPSEISAVSGETGQFPGTRGYGFNLKVSF